MDTTATTAGKTDRWKDPKKKLATEMNAKRNDMWRDSTK